MTSRSKSHDLLAICSISAALSGCAVDGEEASDVASPVSAKTFHWDAIDPYDGDSCKGTGPDVAALRKDYVDGQGSLRVEAGEYRVFVREQICNDDTGCSAWKNTNRIQSIQLDAKHNTDVVERKFVSRGRLYWQGAPVFSKYDVPDAYWDFDGGGPLLSAINVDNKIGEFYLRSPGRGFGDVVFSPSNQLVDIGNTFVNFRDSTLSRDVDPITQSAESLWKRTVGRGCIRITTRQDVRPLNRFLVVWPATKDYTKVELVFYGVFDMKK